MIGPEDCEVDDKPAQDQKAKPYSNLIGHGGPERKRPPR